VSSDTISIVLRSALAIAILVVSILGYWLINQRLLIRAKNNVFTLFSKLPNKPVIVYFTTPDCAPCKTVQRPALNRVLQLLGDTLEVVEIDATQHPDLAKQWGVSQPPSCWMRVVKRAM
jgi:thiol-disulfide isomerase/thioredoxin